MLADRISRENGVRELAEKLMPRMLDLFPDYTPHQIGHLDNVVSIFDWIIPDRVVEVLSAYEIYMLIAAGYLHDIGMIKDVPRVPSAREIAAFSPAFLVEWPNAREMDILSDLPPFFGPPIMRVRPSFDLPFPSLLS
jgi:hypothetical protein